MKNINTQSSLKNIKKIIKDIFSNLQTLRELESNYTWRNILGDYGEFFAINSYNLIKAPSNMKDYDANTKNGKKVQIKSFNTGSNIKFKDSNVDLLLVIQIKDNGDCNTIYFDNFNEVKKISKYSNYSNRFQISISKLKGLTKKQNNSF